MWIHNEGTNKPERVQVDPNYVLIRKNIIFIEEVPSEDYTIPAHYEWDEMEISPNAWTVCNKFLGYDEALDDVYAALTELAEIITEG